MRRNIRFAVLAAVVASAGAIAGCGGDDEAAPAAESGPKVTFVTPAAGSAVEGAVNVRVAVEGFSINPDAVGTAPMEGEGHLHFSMDGGRYDQPRYSGPNGELATKLGTAGKYSPAVAPEITYSDLPAGEHTLKVWLADNTHNDTGVSAETTFTVK